MNKIVFINGYPATGKTLLLNELRKQNVPCPTVTKDGIKEVLFESLGLSTKEHGKQLNQIAVTLMCQQLEESVRAGTPLLLEANFKPIYDQAAFNSILDGAEVDILQVLITAPADVLIARDIKRFSSGQRPTGHEPLNIDTIYETQINIVKHFDFKNATCLTIDSTTIQDNYQQLAAEIIQFIVG